jgi:NAD(P) transhydrogenase subunit alpha
MTLFNLTESLFHKEKGFFIDVDDEIHRGALVLKDGALMWPPPPRPKPAAPAPVMKVEAKAVPHETKKQKGIGSRIAGAVVIALLIAAGLAGPPDFLQHLTVFLLACVVGWQVVWNVTPALHTPLMSVTNAISGIILVGGMVVLGSGAGNVANVLAAAAVLLAAINVAGGFLVTQRMLRMFRK